MSFRVFLPGACELRAPQRGDQRRRLTPLSDDLHAMRANVWHLPPGVRGTRHLEHAQEEMFVVLEGTATLLLGDPPQRVVLPRGGVAVVGTDTGQQIRNDGDGELVVLVVGAPPETGRAELLPDVD
jgi:uncharacterized cupin superfamily protein